MTPGDIRKLIGGYATGTLTEAERQLLFEAALEDQELFDELAREQALKEMLDEPGARDRLIAALQPPRPKEIVIWPWAAAAAVLATGVVMMVVLHKQPAPQQIAAVMQRSEPAAPPIVPAAPPAPRREVAKKVTKPSAEPAPAPPPAAEPEALAIGQLAAPTAPAAQAASGQPVPGQAPQRQAFARAAIAPAAAKAARFAFDYTLDPGGPLQIKTAGDGYLSVIARAAGSGHVVFPSDGDGHVSNGSVTSIDIPQDATEMSIFFSARSGNAVAEDSVAKKDEAAIRDATSGTVEDAAPSPNSRLSVTVRVRK